MTTLIPMTVRVSTEPNRPLLRFIARRWEHWGPWTLYGPASDPPVDYRARHYSRAHELIRRGITARAIQIRSLDDPRPSDAEWQVRIARYEAQSAPRKRKHVTD